MTTQDDALSKAREVALLPCPICGNRAFTSITGEPGARSVWCLTDRCIRLAPRASEAEAITAWNTRAALKLSASGAGEELLAASSDDYWRPIVAEIEAAGNRCRHAWLLNHQAAHLLAWANIARNAALSPPPEVSREAVAGGGELGRFGHHPNAAIDFCIEIEELESIAENARLGLTGFGHEEDRAGLAERVSKAMAFRVGGDENAVSAKAALRRIEAALRPTSQGDVR